MTEGILSGRKVAFLLTNGFEDSELTSPWEAIGKAGGKAVLIAPETGTITGKNGHLARVDLPVDNANASLFDALVLPGGVVNADHLRLNERAVAFVRDIFASNKPVAVICHGAWILADAEVLRGRRITSYPSLATDLRNAGATWVDQEVVVDNGLVSSRRPADLPAFNRKMVEEIAEGLHD